MFKSDNFNRLMPQANPILPYSFEFQKIQQRALKFDTIHKPPKHVLYFDCCDDEYFQKDQGFKGVLEEQSFFGDDFECANLGKVYKISEKRYNIHLNQDDNGFVRWYFFSVKCPTARMLTICIVNMSKNSNLDVAPWIYSSKTGWYRGGENVQYYRSKSKFQRYTLQWTFQFEKEEEYYFAQSQPYGVHRLQEFLTPLTTERNILQCKQLCLCNGIQCPIIQMGDSTKPLIAIIARQHAGEPVSSFVMESMINTIFHSKELRSKFFFKIVPMMAPDAVLQGQNKLNTLNTDINRKWNKVNKTVPSAQYVKAILKKYKNLHLVLDLHQSFNKQGIYFYGYSDSTDFLQQFPTANHSQSRLSKQCGNTLVSALGPLINAQIYQVQISSEIDNKSLKQSDYKEIGYKLALALVAAKSTIPDIPMDYCESESDVPIEVKKKKKSMTDKQEKQFQIKKVVKPFQEHSSNLPNTDMDQKKSTHRVRSYSMKNKK